MLSLDVFLGMKLLWFHSSFLVISFLLGLFVLSGCCMDLSNKSKTLHLVSLILF